MTGKAKIGLALGGGGARGLAHIGVLNFLEREGIPLDLIVGTSIGALVGAAYAAEPDATAIEKKVIDFLSDGGKRSAGFKRLGKIQPFHPEKTGFLHRVARVAEKHVFLSFAILKRALISEENMRALLAVFLPDIDMKDTVIPFAASTVDLVTGKEVILKQGPLIPAVMASCAVPGFLPPVGVDGMVLVDGGVLDPVPVEAAKSAGADIVIAVDVGSCLCRAPSIEDGIDVINRATEIMSVCLNSRSCKGADLVIEPEVKQVPWTGFTYYLDVIGEGEKAAERKIEEIRRMGPTPGKAIWRKILPFPLRSPPWRKRVLSRAK